LKVRLFAVPVLEATRCQGPKHLAKHLVFYNLPLTPAQRTAQAKAAAHHNSMHPLCLAIIAHDLPRVAWLARMCAAPLEVRKHMQRSSC